MADHDPRISEIFYYFSEHTTIESGRQAGRKIGTVQEILIKKLLRTSPRLINGIVYEPKVPGRSGATHKVEFVFFQPLEAAVLHPERSFNFDNPKGLSVLLNAGRRGSGASSVRLNVTYAGMKETLLAEVDRLVPFKGVCERLHKDGFALKTTPLVDEKTIGIAVLDYRRPVASIESKRVGAQRFSGSDKLGSGIQTIEKAKQTSLVALDFDLNFNKTLLALGDRSDRRYKSIAVLGNGVHWTEHDRSILRTYVDNTYLANDDAIIRYAEYVRIKADAAGKDFFPFFMEYFDGMTKTPADDFVVTEDDFPPIEPVEAPGLLSLVDGQLQPFDGA